MSEVKEQEEHFCVFCGRECSFMRLMDGCCISCGDRLQSDSLNCIREFVEFKRSEVTLTDRDVHESIDIALAGFLLENLGSTPSTTSVLELLQWHHSKMEGWTWKRQPKKDPEVDWKPIETAPKDKFVLVACPSGYVTLDWEFVTARFNSDKNRWEEVGHDSLSSSGQFPQYWRELLSLPPDLPRKNVTG